jgi:two-component system, cell cycle response regulator
MAPLLTKILLLEDNAGDARLLREALREITESEFEVAQCETLAQAIESLRNRKPDVVLCDLGLPDCQGLEAVVRIHGEAPDVPQIVLTSLNDESFAVESLKQGAQDYLVKNQIDGGSIWRALRYAMERQRVQLELLSLALIDEITGLNNRRGFLRLAEQHAKLAYRSGEPFLLAFVDLDGMKQINDTFGHQEGDRALVEVSNVLKDTFRQSDILARWGGDEFVALIADASKADIESVVHRLHQKLNSLNARPNHPYPLSLSIGVVANQATQPASLELLLSQADALMYQEKQGKRSARKLGTGR